ncbi:SPY [Symbiodinium microadriaticum]|nr:SPY [Symbiodinium microadriaticum]
MQLQEWDAAVTALVRCAWADPLSSLPFFRIGQIEILRQRFESAERWLSAAIEKFGASLMVRDEEIAFPKFGSDWQPKMARPELHGPARAQRRYLHAVGRQVKAMESQLFSLDEQLATLERECGCPRPKQHRLAPNSLPRSSSRQVLAELATTTLSAAMAHSKMRFRMRFQLKTWRRRTLQPAGKRSLAVLHVSPRYGKVDAKVLGLQRSRNMKQKIAQGRYTHTWGQFKQDGFRQALQTPPDTEAASLKEVDLIAWEGKQPVTYALRDGSREPLRLTFWATQESVNSLFDWCKWFESSTSLPQHPYPVLIPSKGRAKAAHLNWRAPHCFGPAAFQSDGQRQSPSALVVAVVEPSEAKEYREAWADLPLLVLPENDMGPAFVRWCIQKVSSAFRMEQCHELGALQQMRYCWLVDDSITSFYRLNPLSDQSLQEEDERLQSRGIVVPATSLSKPAGRKSERRCHGAMFAEAMLAVQQQASRGTCAICGFLRDDGTAPMKSAQWALDSTSVFKVVLLNLVELAKLQVEYLPQLHLFEDVCLNVQARNSGGRILKCLRYCYWADNKTFGGCAEQRAQKAAAPRCTGLEDLIPASAFMELTAAAKTAVEHVYGWVHRDEERSRLRKEALGMPAPLPAPETEVLPLTEGSEEATDMQHHGVTFFDEHFFDPFQDLDWSQTALEDIQIQVIQDDRSREVFHDLALAMFQNGKIDQAETRLQIALQLNPDFAKGWNNLGCCLASRMNLHDGARAVRKAVSLNPDNPQYWANLAVLSQHLGDHTTSQSAMSNALQLWPSMPEHRDCAWEFAPAS